ncbi:MAG: VWA domain-containing protein [Phycisphaerae bacterium]
MTWVWANPWMLGLGVLLLPIWWGWLRRKPHAAVRFSSIAWLKEQGGNFRVKARHIIPLLRTVAVGILVVCLARPQQPNQETRIRSEGIAIQMLVDRSSSMQAMDFALEGRRVDRLTAVKNVVEGFVFGGQDVDGRPDDLIGMITFAGYADSRCPLTLDHAFLVQTLEQTEIVSPEEGREEDGTAIGDGIALAVERLVDLDRRRQVHGVRKVKNRIIILLTDGENNRGDVSPQKAAELAAEYDIKIYTIGAGTTGIAPIPVRNAFGNVVMRPTRVTIDEATLKQIADATGGQYWRAKDTDSLREIYAEIDALEKTETEEKRYFQRAELATEWVSLGGVALPPLLAMAAGLLALEVLLVNTRFRKVP